MFHLRFGLSDHLKTLRDFVFGSRRRVKKVRIFRAWFSQTSQRMGMNPPMMSASPGKKRPKDGRSVWECSHTHNPGGEHLASLLPQLCTHWPAFLEGVGVQLPNFKEFIEQAYGAVTFATRPGVAAWRFPPHSLATNTFRLLFFLHVGNSLLSYYALEEWPCIHQLFVNSSAPMHSSMNVISNSIKTSLRKSALTRKLVHPITDHCTRPSSRNMVSSLSSTYTIVVPGGP